MVFDFYSHIEWLWKISKDREFICLDNDMNFERTKFE